MFFEYISFMCEFFFGVGALLFMFGLPILLVTVFFILPAIYLRKYLKSGKSLRDLLAECEYDPNFSHTPYNHNRYSQSFPSSGAINSGTSITDYVSNPLYAPFSGNISHRS